MIDDAIPDLVSRRNFLRGAVGLAGVASMGALFGCSSGEPSAVAHGRHPATAPQAALRPQRRSTCFSSSAMA